MVGVQGNYRQEASTTNPGKGQKQWRIMMKKKAEVTVRVFGCCCCLVGWFFSIIETGFRKKKKEELKIGFVCDEMVEQPGRNVWYAVVLHIKLAFGQ